MTDRFQRNARVVECKREPYALDVRRRKVSRCGAFGEHAQLDELAHLLLTAPSRLRELGVTEAGHDAMLPNRSRLAFTPGEMRGQYVAGGAASFCDSHGNGVRITERTRG